MEEQEFYQAVAIYYDGRNSYQSNFFGYGKNLKEEFPKEMKKQGAVWGKLFTKQTGQELFSYAEQEKEKGE